MGKPYAVSPERRRAFGEWAGAIQEKMFLCPFRVKVEFRHLKGAYAEVRPWHAQAMRVTLTLDEAFWKLDASDQRYCITHEMVHLIHRDQSDMIRVGGLHKVVAPDMWNTLWDRFKVETEQMTDWLARIIMELMPMPPEWPQ